MFELHLNSAAVIQVIQSWEVARQRHGFDEQLGIDTLMLYVDLSFFRFSRHCLAMCVWLKNRHSHATFLLRFFLRYSNDNTRLFKMDPGMKSMFGFHVNKQVNPVGLERMGILIHGLGIVHMLDAIFAALGPDLEILQVVVAEVGEKHSKLGLSPDHFLLLCRALLHVLEDTMGDEWDDTTLRSSWFQVIRVVSFEIARSM